MASDPPAPSSPPPAGRSIGDGDRGRGPRDGPRAAGPGSVRALRQVQAARLRARATRSALLRVFLGSVFLIGALAHALSPGRHEQSALAWMAGLLVLSSLNVGLGLYALARLRRRSPRLWMAGTAAWAVLSVALVAFLVRG